MKPFNPFSGPLRKRWLSAAILLAFACGPSFDPGEFVSFFQPESASMRPEDYRYIFTPQLYADSDLYGAPNDSVTIDENVHSWVKYAGGTLSDTVWSKALYTENADARAQVTSALEQTKPSAATYLKFAWSVENVRSNPWPATATPIDSSKLPKQLADAKTAYQNVADAFLKERYAFQAVKLASEQGDFRQTQQLYDQLIKPLSQKTFISDWALCRRAGATLALRDTARAIYEFAQVFDRCPSRRKAAELSLRRYGLHFREDALQYAKTDPERAAVYAICAIQPGQDGLDLLKALVYLAPKNPLVELVMAREINRNEYYFFSTGQEFMNDAMLSNPDSTRFEGRKAEAVSYFDKLRSFALESAENSKPGDGAFWYTAGAYLDYLGHDYEAAQTHLDQAARLPTTNAHLKSQIAVQRMLLLAAQTESITPEAENQLIGYLEEFGKITNFRLNNAFVRVCQTFADTYQHKSKAKSGWLGWLSSCTRSALDTPDGTSMAKAYLLTMLTTQANSDTYFASTVDERVIDDTIAPAIVRQTIAFANQPTHTDFDNRLLKLAGQTNDNLYLLLGRRLMMGHRYAEAADAFSKVDPKTWSNDAFSTYFQRDPFSVKMPRIAILAQNGTAAINFPEEPKTNSFTPVTFARRMADLAQQAPKATGDQAAELYYHLGCGAWNLSWYGNAWLLAKSYWSTAEPPVYDTPTDPLKRQRRFDSLLKTDYYTTDRAKQYFVQSAKMAKSPALADRSAYMAARCEANAFAVQRSIEQVRHGYVYEEDSTFVRNMRALRKSKYAGLYNEFYQHHRQTMFDQAMIRECAMYKDFLSFGAQSNE